MTEQADLAPALSKPAWGRIVIVTLPQMGFAGRDVPVEALFLDGGIIARQQSGEPLPSHVSTVHAVSVNLARALGHSEEDITRFYMIPSYVSEPFRLEDVIRVRDEGYSDWGAAASEMVKRVLYRR
jgi:hypothetical protein